MPAGRAAPGRSRFPGATGCASFGRAGGLSRRRARQARDPGPDLAQLRRAPSRPSGLRAGAGLRRIPRGAGGQAPDLRVVRGAGRAFRGARGRRLLGPMA